MDTTRGLSGDGTSNEKRGNKMILVPVSTICSSERLMRAELKDVRETVKDTPPVKIRTYGMSLAQRYLDEKHEK